MEKKWSFIENSSLKETAKKDLVNLLSNLDTFHEIWIRKDAKTSYDRIHYVMLRIKEMIMAVVRNLEATKSKSEETMKVTFESS